MTDRANPVGDMMAMIDGRARKQRPRSGATWGLYVDSTERYVDLDTGERVPEPATWLTVYSGRRYPCFFMQGGHDVLVLGELPEYGTG